jgi:hypothetical protein
LEALPPTLDNQDQDGFHCDPQKIRLALTDEKREIRVSWNTHGGGCHSNVHFGLALTTPGMLSGNATQLASRLESVADYISFGSYGPEDFCGEPAQSDDFSPPNLHSAVLTDLEAGQWYEYRIGHHDPVRRFRAPPEVGPDSVFTFITYGDMGESVHRAAKSPGAYLTAQQVTTEVLEGGAELVIHVGDIAYADGEHKIWDTFLEQIEPFASRAPYQISVGNHEYDWETGKEKHRHKHATDASGREKPYDPDWGNFGNDSGGECGVTVSKLFPMPGSGLGSQHNQETDDNGNHLPAPPFWFSYDYGAVHFTTLSSEHDLTHGSRQIQWLKRDLKSVDRCVTPWLVLLIHRPMYVVHPHKSNRIVGEHLRESLEDIMEEYEVDLAVSGHVHAYARTCNVYKEECIGNDDGGTTHVTLGCGGRKLSDVKHEQPEWLEYAEREYGFGRVTVEGRRHLRFEYVHSATGRVADSVELKIGRSAMRMCGLEAELRQEVSEGLPPRGSAGAGTSAEDSEVVGLEASAGVWRVVEPPAVELPRGKVVPVESRVGGRLGKAIPVVEEFR